LEIFVFIQIILVQFFVIFEQRRGLNSVFLRTVSDPRFIFYPWLEK